MFFLYRNHYFNKRHCPIINLCNKLSHIPCKYIKKEEVVQKEVCDCPNCDGKIIERKSRKGKLFYGCANYPKCKTAFWDMPIGKECPDCGEMLVTKNEKIKCSSCDYKED